MQIKYNKSIRHKTIKYIVVHDTGNRNIGANAMNNFNYFNSRKVDSSADFFVDSKQALCVNDYKKYYTWHCGDGNGKYGITNENSVGVELCINSDGDYDTAFKNMVKCVKSLMSELNIPIERVVRHYDASRKNCPQTFNKNGNWNKWYEFKQKLVENGDEDEMIYNYIDENMPEWARPTIQKLVDKGLLKGNEKGELGLNDTMLKIFVINDRAGLY